MRIASAHLSSAALPHPLVNLGRLELPWRSDIVRGPGFPLNPLVKIFGLVT
jgi:hypothetical protein